MISKVATHKKPEMILFKNKDHELDYWDSLCSLCYDRECEETCILMVPGLEDCEACNGTGRVRFRVRPVDRPYYECITLCGYCEGVGMN